MRQNQLSFNRKRTATAIRAGLLPMLLALVVASPGWSQQAAQRSAQPRASSGSSSGSSGRSAVSSGGGRHAQPRGGSSSHSSGGNRSSTHRRTGYSGHRGGHGGYGYRGYGGYYGGSHYGYSNWYFGVGYGFGSPFWGVPSYYGSWYRTHPYYYYPAYGGYVAADSGYARRTIELGAVDLGIKPKRARVYLDGRYLGLAKQFDGSPTYLWVEEGEHTLTLYHPGYVNLVRSVVIDPGQVLTVKDSMIAGQEVLPDPPPEVERAPRPERPGRDTAHLEQRAPSRPAANDARAAPARLTLDVEPEDASIYLNGRFLGSGREISNLRAPLIIDGGDHVLQVVHPDFRTEKREFSVAEGETLDLEVELDRQ